jgi:peptide-methionine (R)-S-oxide reductase
MKQSIVLILAPAVALAVAACSRGTAREPTAAPTGAQPMPPIQKTDEEWRKTLTPEQYRVLREKGTERPWSGEYVDTKDPGVYKCAGCGQELFVSETKFDSGCGWPSFYQPADPKNVATQTDRSHGMVRSEVLCSRCGGHLGHVFDDGPNPTGLRYCINSAALKMEKR